MSQAQWNAIARENGYPLVLNHGQAVQAAHRGEVPESLLRAAPVRVHCAYAGCGRWVKAGADRCSAGHPQSDDAPEAEVAPF